MSDQITPRLITWQCPEGHEVVLDEDGIHLRHGAGGLESCDLDRLLEIIAEAKRVREMGLCPIPKAPSRERLHYYPASYVAARAKHAAGRAIDAEFTPTDAPF